MVTTKRDLNLVKKAVFLSSNNDPQRCPSANLPEYAFIGRSNVGKSSLLNAFAQRKDLAKVSGTPGKTQTINHYLMDDSWYWVDLPGYGYAKAPKTLVSNWEKFINTYLQTRKNLLSIFVLLDVRLTPQKNDIDFMTALGEAKIPFAMIFTKIDKCSYTQVQKNIAFYQKTMLQNWESLPPIFQTSAHHFQGLKQLHQYIVTNNLAFLQ